ncbi:MAG: ABC transporter G family member 24-like [Trebouxia sp. A1-2]|nr:MAG: ABC transporter G family member 24-like [Trebouxia sp. A1-2]
MLDLEFTNMGMRLKDRAEGVGGVDRSGKTSLMAALAGKASYGTVSGSVKVNGKADKLLRYKRVMGFVPQDDIMYTNLTVEENLLFSAQYRLPVHYTHAQHVYYVERAIQILALDDIRNEIIGDEEVRGISGGQRKRVNVGLELVADPIMLFLDEPTSGLDSTSSKMVISALQQVAHMGVTIAAVIHQPSYEIFQMFDDILLLAKGGRTAFYGPEGQVQGYFEKLGYALPQRTNPADVYMDIIAGIKSRVDGPPQTPQDLAAAWDDHNLPPDQPPTPRPLPDSDTDSDSGQADSSLSGFGPAELAEYSIPLPGTPMTPAVGPMHNKAGQWLRRKWKKGLLVGAYLGKELREQMAAFRCVFCWAL